MFPLLQFGSLRGSMSVLLMSRSLLRIQYLPWQLMQALVPRLHDALLVYGSTLT
jgi:hypothetical protein